jgi:hypothetical protein
VYRKIYNRELYELINEPDIVRYIKINRLGGARHVIRMSNNRTAKKVQLVRWDMSYDLGWCSIHFSGEKLKATAHVSANELYFIPSQYE